MQAGQGLCRVGRVCEQVQQIITWRGGCLGSRGGIGVEVGRRGGAGCGEGEGESGWRMKGAEVLMGVVSRYRPGREDIVGGGFW